MFLIGISIFLDRWLHQHLFKKLKGMPDWVGQGIKCQSCNFEFKLSSNDKKKVRVTERTKEYFNDSHCDILEVDCPRCIKLIRYVNHRYGSEKEIRERYVAHENLAWLKDKNFFCQYCKHEFKPDLLEDAPGRSVRIEIYKFFPPADTGGDWSPTDISVTAYAECPKCKEETCELKSDHN